MFRFLVVLFSVLLFSNIAHADFVKGLKAYDEGEYGIAFQEWGRAAENGDVAAQRNLGHLYRWGKGVDKDSGKAAYWYLKASKSGFSRAQYNLAMMYLKGEGVPKDFYESVRWLKLSAKQAYKPAVTKLAELRADGKDVDGVEKPKTRTKTSVTGFEKTDYHKNLKVEQPKSIVKAKEEVKTEPIKSNNELETNNVFYSDNDFYLHVGSYKKMDNSDKGWGRISKKYSLDKEKVIFKTIKVKKVNYIRLYAFGQKTVLQEACAKMKKAKEFCELYDGNFKKVSD